MAFASTVYDDRNVVRKPYQHVEVYMNTERFGVGMEKGLGS
jgi:hypothetical protein